MSANIRGLFGMALVSAACYTAAAQDERPNILFIFSDDHAVDAIGAYGSPLTERAPTPNIDRIAHEGALFRNNFCANSICAPSRASVLTGKHSHMNGQLTNRDRFDGSQATFPQLLQKAGYATAIFGKWHLKSDPTGFDEWMVYPGQGYYYNPDYLTAEGNLRIEGYSVEVTTDLALDFIKKNAGGENPFLLMCQFKAPHRNWMPGPEYLTLFDDVTFPEPDTLFDDYEGRTSSAAGHHMGIDEHMTMFYDLKVEQMPQRYAEHMELFFGRMTPEQRAAWDSAYAPKNKAFMEAGLTGQELVRWKYQRYVKDYLRCVAAVDHNIGRLLTCLDENGLSENTIVVYSSDQGFYLGEHGWFDKRWMYEESFRMPLLMRWPGRIKPGTEIMQLTQNIDFAPTFLEAAGLEIPADMQGASTVPLLAGNAENWRSSIYYHYYQGGGHGVPVHEGIRNAHYKLIHFYQTDEWELFDLKTDPNEMTSQHNNPKYVAIRKNLEEDLNRLKEKYNVTETPQRIAGGAEGQQEGQQEGEQ